MKWYEYISRIDRKYIYLIVAIAVLIPIIFPFSFTTNVMPPSRQLFDYIDNMDPEAQALFISVDYDPQVSPELHPMYTAVLRHAFSRHLPVIVYPTMIPGIGLAAQGLDSVSNEFNRRAATHEDSIIYGRDYVFVAWVPLPIVAMLRMASDITRAFPSDYYNNRTAKLELMDRIKNYNDIGIVVSISGSTWPLAWVRYANARFGQNIGCGITAVMAADFYPYLKTGQLTGMLSGLKGASEYEYMVENNYNTGGTLLATLGMSSQSVAMLVIMIFVILGNIGYFMTRRKP